MAIFSPGWTSKEQTTTSNLVSVSISSLLHTGHKKVKLFAKEFDYKGELDKDGNVCGHGVATRKTYKYEGTFLNNQAHGFGKSFIADLLNPLFRHIDRRYRDDQ